MFKHGFAALFFVITAAVFAQVERASIIGNVVTPWNEKTDPFLRYLHHQRIYNPYTLTSGPMDFSYYHTGNVSTLRSTLLDVGGFNEDFFIYGMEDIELGYRLEKAGSRMVAMKPSRTVEPMSARTFMPLVANWPGAIPGLLTQPPAVPPGQSMTPPPPDGFHGS